MKKALMLASVASMIDQFNMNNISILNQLGFAVEVACNFKKGSSTSQSRVDEFRKELESKGIITYQVCIPRKISDVSGIKNAYRQVKTLVEKEQYDIVHCHSPIGGVIARLACRKIRRNGTKVIYTAHGFHFYKGAPAVNWIIYYPVEKFFARFTDVLITINKDDYSFAKKRLKAKSIKYVPGIGIDTDYIKNINTDREQKLKEVGIDSGFILLSVGELNKNKNQEVIIRALAKTDKNEDIKYLICGKGENLDYLKQLAKDLHLENRVFFAGYRDDIKELLKSCDLFCFPSFREGLSVALMEALASGMPVVCSAIRGNTDLIEDGKGGFLVKADDADAFAEKIEALYSDKKLCAQMGKENLQHIKLFSIDKVNDIMREIYKDL